MRRMIAPLPRLVLRPPEPRDLAALYLLEQISFGCAWTLEQIDYELREFRAFAACYETNHDAELAGAIYWRTYAACLEITNLAVMPAMRRRGIATRLVCELACELRGRRDSIMALVGERNLPAQRLFRRCGYRAESIEAGAFEPFAADDAYLFRYRPPSPSGARLAMGKTAA